MRFYIRGTRPSAARTALWSSGSRRNRPGGVGRWLALLLLPVAAIGIAPAFTHWPFDLIVAGLVALALAGRHVQKKEKARAEATIADLNARPAGIRARLRELNRTGELASIPGWHWTRGNLLERDAWPAAGSG